MDELPPEARALLALVEDGHEPPAGARERVWRGAALGIAAGAGVTGAHVAAAKSAGTKAALTSFAAKVTGVVLVAGAGVAGSIWVSARPAPRALPPRTQVAAPSATSETVRSPAPLQSTEEPPEAAPAPGPAPRDTGRKPPPLAHRGQAPEVDTLLQEVTALRAASDALARDQPARALALLRAHERKFRSAALAEEREALVLLARCTLDGTAPRQAARAFLRRAPSAVLRGRIERACRLEGEEP